MPEVIFSNNIRIKGWNEKSVKAVKNMLTLTNPEYVKKERMGLWLGNTPRNLCLYEEDGDTLIIPYGMRNSDFGGNAPLLLYGEEETVKVPADYKGAKVELYDYQREAMQKAHARYCGIIQAPTGSGKTQMGIALAVYHGQRTLWLTHTSDLLNQSLKRAKKYIDPSTLGTITAGKVNLGSTITFATVQTMAKLDLSKYADKFGVVIVDECHHVAGTPTKVMQFYKVVSTMKARYKYGLSATVHRADGLIKATYAVLGKVVAEVTKEMVGNKIVEVGIRPRWTEAHITEDCLMPDGTLSYTKTIKYLSENARRNSLICDDAEDDYEEGRYILILCNTVEHVRTLYDRISKDGIEEVEMIYGAISKKERERILESARIGETSILISTYSLAKEGLDIPILDRLYLATPQKDFTVVTQSVGRISRAYPGKTEAIVYDYVDDDKYFVNAYKKRCAHYKKANCYAYQEKEN